MDETPEEARREAARVMGSARSEAKAAAARLNGGKGGRPRGYVASPETRRRQSEGIKRAIAARKGDVAAG